MTVQFTREERAAIRLARYRKRAAAERQAAKKRTAVRRQIKSMKPKRVTYSERPGKHESQTINPASVARKRKVVMKRRKTIARASRQRNRR